MRVVAPLVLGFCALCADALVLRDANLAEVPGDALGKIVKMLSLAKVKMERELMKVEQHNDKYGCWYKEYKDRNEALVSELKSNITSLEESNKESSSKVATLQAEKANAEKELNDLIAEFEETSKSCAQAKSEFEANKADLENTIKLSTNALAALDKQHETIDSQTDQFDEDKENTNLLAVTAEARRKTVDAALRFAQSSEKYPLTEDEKVAATAFLSRVARYESSSGPVIGILKNMLDTAKKELKEAIAEDEEKSALCSDQVKDNGNEQSSKKDTIANLGTDLAETQEKLTNEEKEYEDDKAESSQRIANLDSQAVEFRDYQYEFSQHVKLASGEIEAVEKAIQILNSTEAQAASKQSGSRFMYFLQVQPSRIMKAYKALKDAFHNTGEVRVALLASRMMDVAHTPQDKNTAGQFDQIIRQCERMIQGLDEEGAEDDADKENCQAQKSDLDGRKASATNDKDNAESAITKENQRIADFNNKVDSTDAKKQEAENELEQLTSERTASHDDFIQTRKNDQKTVEILTKAIGVIADWYANNLRDASMLQGKPKSKYAVDEENSGARKIKKYKGGSMTKGVVGLMNGMKKDLEDTMARDAALEDEAISDFIDFKAKALNTINMLVQAVADYQKAITAANKRIADETDNKDEAIVVLGEVADAHKVWENACNWVKSSYAKRKERRAAERKALVYGIEVLRGGGDRN